MKTSDKKALGYRGERAAEAFLIQSGFALVARNYRWMRAEIDLILSRDDLLIFVEVKTRTSTVFGFPEQFLESDQVERILEAADQYLMESKWDGRVRYDIVAVYWQNGVPRITHFEDAFY